MSDLLTTLFGIIVVIAIGAAGTLYFGAIIVEEIREMRNNRKAGKSLW